jgi:hypothetical protein
MQKKFYYYEYTDDGESWSDGDCAFSLLKCIDRARKCSYRWRIKNEKGEVVCHIKVADAPKTLEQLERLIT